MLADVTTPLTLAVLNACDTGSAGANTVITALAGALVSRGVPAAIATLRPVVDYAAVYSQHEFYRAFADGYSLEAAVSERAKH